MPITHRSRVRKMRAVELIYFSIFLGVLFAYNFSSATFPQILSDLPRILWIGILGLIASEFFLWLVLKYNNKPRWLKNYLESVLAGAAGGLMVLALKQVKGMNFLTLDYWEKGMQLLAVAFLFVLILGWSHYNIVKTLEDAEKEKRVTVI